LLLLRPQTLQAALLNLASTGSCCEHVVIQAALSECVYVMRAYTHCAQRVCAWVCVRNACIHTLRSASVCSAVRVCIQHMIQTDTRIAQRVSVCIMCCMHTLTALYARRRGAWGSSGIVHALPSIFCGSNALPASKVQHAHVNEDHPPSKPISMFDE